MKGQKGGRVSMPLEYFDPLYHGNFSQHAGDVSLNRGEVSANGCHMGPVPHANAQVGGRKKARRSKKSRKAKAKKSKARKSRRGRQ